MHCLGGDVLKKLISEESGQGMVEYALIISMISVLVLTIVRGTADQIRNMYQYSESQITEMLKELLKYV